MKARALLLLLLIGVVAADAPPPANLHDLVGFDQLLGAQIPMTTQFADSRGGMMTLNEISNGKPLVLAMGYYRCPNLCDAMLTSMAQAVAKTRLQVGRDFAVVFIGIDPSEGTSEAQQARESLQHRVPAAAVEQWQLLVGDEAAIRSIANAVGYRYHYDPEIDQYIHPAGLVVADKEGVVSQYLFGVGPSDDSLRLALISASASRIGSLVDQLVLLCSGYDPQTGRYSIMISKVLRLLGLVTTVFLLALVLYLQRRQSGRGG